MNLLITKITLRKVSNAFNESRFSVASAMWIIFLAWWFTYVSSLIRSIFIFGTFWRNHNAHLRYIFITVFRSIEPTAKVLVKKNNNDLTRTHFFRTGSLSLNYITVKHFVSPHLYAVVRLLHFSVHSLRCALRMHRNIVDLLLRNAYNAKTYVEKNAVRINFLTRRCILQCLIIAMIIRFYTICYVYS